MFAEIGSLWYVSGFLLLSPAFPDNIPDLCLHISCAFGWEKEAPACVTFEDSTWRAWNHGSSLRCSVKLRNPRLTRTPAFSPPMCHSHPFLPHPMPRRGSQGCMSGCQPAPGTHLSWVVSLTIVPVRHGVSQCSEEYVVARDDFYFRHRNSLSTP